ncbi:MAG: HNH endonuclease [Deltaproteobacteria bacterium]|nr:HNH endonuclease [Deltaproteobacteria bacterium]
MTMLSCWEEVMEMRTLVLTQGYQPHGVVSWKRGILLSFGGKVEVLERYAEVARSPSVAIPIPSVVRLLRSYRRGRQRVRFCRENVLRRDGYTCAYCGSQPAHRELTLDHVVPRSRGGETRWENVVTACRPCNNDKGSLSLEQAGMKLAKRPKSPRWLPARDVGLGLETPESWDPWIAWAR